MKSFYNSIFNFNLNSRDDGMLKYNYLFNNNELFTNDNYLLNNYNYELFTNNKYDNNYLFLYILIIGMITLVLFIFNNYKLNKNIKNLSL